MTLLDVFAMIGVVSVPASLGLGAALWAARAELRVRRENDQHHLNQRVIEEALINSRQLESTVDMMALELERLAESQRFMARALTERPAPPLPGDQHHVRRENASEASNGEALPRHGPAPDERVRPVP